MLFSKHRESEKRSPRENTAAEINETSLRVLHIQREQVMLLTDSGALGRLRQLHIRKIH
jgi:hypothetical protein